MNDSIFRKKSLDRAGTSDNLNNAINVAQPMTWMVLVAIVLVLAGFFVWAVFGTLNSTVTAVVVVSDGQAGCYVSEDDYNEISSGMDVIGTDGTGRIGSVDVSRSCFGAKVDDYIAHAGDFDDSEYLYFFDMEGDMPDGIGQAKIITEKITPISFLWN